MKKEIQTLPTPKNNPLDSPNNNGGETKRTQSSLKLKQNLMRKPKISVYKKYIFPTSTKSNRLKDKNTITSNVKYNEEIIKKEFELNKFLLDQKNKCLLYDKIQMNSDSIKLRNYIDDVKKIARFTKISNII